MDAQAFLTLGIILIISGLLLLLADLFVPSGGLLAMLSLGSIVVGILCLFRHSTTAGLVGVGGIVLVLPLFAGLLIKFWSRTPLGRMAHAPVEDEETLPAQKELQMLKGRYGKTLTALKPAGMVDFDGRRVDSLTEGMMVEAGRWVRCVQVRGSAVIVRPVDQPNVNDLETAIFK